MKTVYVIGAGCTRNYEAKNPLKLQSPLDVDFFKICNKILIANKELLQQLSKLGLIGHLKQLFRLELGSTTDPPETSLEEVTTVLDQESKQSERGFLEPFINLIEVVFDKVLGNPNSEIHNELATRIKPNDTIISYNYDTVMDNSLMDVKKIDERIYNLHFDRSYDRDWKRCEQGPTNVLFLKLHGSLNWAKCLGCGALIFYKSRTVASQIPYLRIGLGKPSGGATCPFCEVPSLATVIIPPLLQKETQREEYSYSWYVSGRQLASADRITVIGYSLPPTDFQSDLLFRRAANLRLRGKLSLRVVDPKEKVRDRFKEIFAPDDFKAYNCLREYLDGEPA